MIHIGILGGGQLAKMLLEAARDFAIETSVLEQDVASLCKQLATHSIDGSLYDTSALHALVSSVDITTYEIEHIDIQTLLVLEEMGHRFVPSPKILEIIQDKGKQKDFFIKHNLPTAPYQIIESMQAIGPMVEDFSGEKIVVKSCTGGYDGKGVVVTRKDEIFNNVRFTGACVVEQYIEQATELAVMVARDMHGATVCYEPVEMIFNEHNTLAYQLCPATIDLEVRRQVRDIATRTIEAYDGVGIFAIEFFLTPDGRVYINEVAPRPHNSGHHTIEACITSQYTQLLNILLGLPLGSVEMKHPSIMVNLLGPANHEGRYKLLDKTLCDIPGVYVHLYGKYLSKPNRKLGHVTIVADTLAEVIQKHQDIQHLLHLIPSHD